MKYLVIAILLYAYCATAQGEENSCMKLARSQIEMNQCNGLDLSVAEDELARVLAEIKQVYKSTSPEMLEKLEMSQDIWEKSVEADMDLKFPLE